MAGVCIDAVEEVLVGRFEQVGDGRQVSAAVAESLAATQYHVQTCAVGSQTDSRPTTLVPCRILDPGNDDSLKYVVLRSCRSAMLAQH